MIRRVIHIDEDKCNGCGACVTACHEGAIGLVDGKARLMRDDYCDGLGDCLPQCPTGAISFVEREAAAYDEAAVLANKAAKEQAEAHGQTHEGGRVQAESQAAPQKPHFSGCLGSMMRQFNRNNQGNAATGNPAAGHAVDMSAQQELQSGHTAAMVVSESQLAQWPCQIKLVPVNAPYFDGAKLLIAADCTAYAYANMHQEFMKGKITIIGCPKLDDVDYSEKLTQIISNNNIKSVSIVRMEVPCCGGLEYAAKTALQNSGKFIPWQVVTISIDGKILD